MLRSAPDFKIPIQDWNSAKAQACEAMIERARKRGMIPYSELVREISAVKFEAFDTRLFHMLGEISVEENAAGRGMLSAVVVHKAGDMEPGPGFFLLGKHLGHDTRDLLKFWIQELHKVHAAWGAGKR